MRALLVLTLALFTLHCDDGGSSMGADAGPLEPGDTFTFSGSYELEGGEEKFLCYTWTFAEAVAFDRFEVDATPGVHHMVVSRAIAPEPEGSFECDVLFRNTWVPLFGTGNGASSLETPEGTAFRLAAGEQVVMQLHLFNTGAERIEETVDVRARIAGSEEERVGIFAFGTSEIDLPARESTTITNECEVERDVDAFGVLPHMHYLGLTLELETSTDGGTTWESVYTLDSWNFDRQEIEEQPISIAAGSLTRVHCTYENPTDGVVTFGESSESEMCFLVLYEVGGTGALDGCVNLGDPGTGGPMCEPTENELGIGAACTPGGGECNEGLTCTSDQPGGSDGDGFCLQVGGCTTSDECGSGAVCCAPAAAGGLLNICIPEVCRPDDCADPM